jgi:hypothetical protein
VNDAEGLTVPRRAGGAAIAAVALLFVLLAGGWLIGTRVHLVGTNSTAPRYSLPALTPGHKLCLKGLTLPANANAIGLLLAAKPGAPSPVTLTLQAAGRTQVARGEAPAVGFGGRFRFAAPGREVPASACLTTARSLVAESGTFSTNSGTGAAFLDGKPVGGMLTVSYLHLPSRRLLSALPAAAHRASLFRAGFVGAWTYWLLAALVLIAWAVGLRLVLRGGR